jgi:DNA invertase Pin-like site-specific DNA recombinase
VTKAFAFLRVSGKGQEAGDGYTRQTQSIHRYAAANGIKVIRIFKECGVSGEKELKDRPVFMEDVDRPPFKRGAPHPDRTS